jgi:cystathionine beta-lyase
MRHPTSQRKDAFHSIVPAIHHGTTVLVPSLRYLREEQWREGGFVYGLHQNPTTLALGEQLCAIEGAEHCSLLPSGLSAINVVNQTLLEPGSEVLLPQGLYRSNRRLIEWYAMSQGVSALSYSSTHDAVDQISDRTRLIWTECPASISMEVMDLPLLVKEARQKGQGRIIVANDNSWSAGVFYQPLSFGVDVVVQALTKYQSGGADVFMGAILTRDKQLHERFEQVRDMSGLGVGAHDAYLVIRGMSSLKIRMVAHQNAAMRIAGWLDGQRVVAQVLHPAFPDCPGHDIWSRDFAGSSGLFSVLLHPSISAHHMEQFVQKLQVFGLGLSWGGAQSLCMVYELPGQSPQAPPNQVLRLSIGLEDPEILIADLALAFELFTYIET